LQIHACDKGWKIRINKVVAGHDKREWVRVGKKGKNKEKYVNGAIFLIDVGYLQQNMSEQH
jgi:hypothetical protein